ncbi:serine/threonine-protein kinase [Nakamurella aerolata]|uniref:non-specific serine/threonine protein kinase n=1 Tax=Nakamurella aerolata TaxID=1656892 RepID=A0A849AAG7_9ACTN|nr:serine/threonine-protein kinase [Nakamurella aerolata]NNG37509.1 serine/threonine protein kinase [Nakamurella aerolata]
MVGHGADQPDEPDAPGFVLGGYRALRLLATGGSSRVYEAAAPGGERVALKVLDGPYQAALTAAKRQVALTTMVNHRHVVPVQGPVYDVGRVAVVSELAAGGTLADLLGRRGPLAPAELLTLLIPLAAALATGHEREVVHGDLTPANVLFDAAGRPLLTDLGAAQIVVDCGLPVAATPPFVAPEVARRARPTAAADVFSLGAVALFAATGRPAWNADDIADVVVQSTVGQWPDLPDELRQQFPAPLRKLLRSMLAELPADRPGAARVVMELSGCGRPAPIELAAAGDVGAGDVGAGDVGAGDGAGADVGGAGRPPAGGRAAPPGRHALPDADLDSAVDSGLASDLASGGWRSVPLDELQRRRPLTGADWRDGAPLADADGPDAQDATPPATVEVAPRAGLRPDRSGERGAKSVAHQRVRRIVTQIRPGAAGSARAAAPAAARPAAGRTAGLMAGLVGRTRRERGLRAAALAAVLVAVLVVPGWLRGSAGGQPLSVQPRASATATATATETVSASAAVGAARVAADETPSGAAAARRPPTGGWLGEVRRLDRARAEALVSRNSAALAAVYADTAAAASALAADRGTIEQLRARGWRVQDAAHRITTVGVIDNSGNSGGDGSGGDGSGSVRQRGDGSSGPVRQSADGAGQSAGVMAEEPELITLRVVDELPAYQVFDDAGNPVGRTPARGSAARIVQLAPVDTGAGGVGGYRIAAIG